MASRGSPTRYAERRLVDLGCRRSSHSSATGSPARWTSSSEESIASRVSGVRCTPSAIPVPTTVSEPRVTKGLGPRRRVDRDDHERGRLAEHVELRLDLHSQVAQFPGPQHGLLFRVEPLRMLAGEERL